MLIINIIMLCWYFYFVNADFASDIVKLKQYQSSHYHLTTHAPFPVQIGTGYDVTTGKQLLPVMLMTYNDSYIPYQVNITNEIHNTTTTTNYNNYVDYLSSISNYYMSSPSSVFANDYPSFSSNFLLNKYKIIITTHKIDLFHLSLKDIPLMINPITQQIIDTYLPNTYNYQVYKLFILNFGTHVIVKADAGCKFEQFIQSFQCNMLGSIDLNSNAALYLAKEIYANQYQHQQFTGKFLQYTKASIVNMYGGDPELVNSGDWSRRIDTCAKYPVITSLSLKPITDFIRNTTIKTNLQKAITAYVQEYSNTIHQIQSNQLIQPIKMSFVGSLIGKMPNIPIQKESIQVITKNTNFDLINNTSVHGPIVPINILKPDQLIWFNLFYCIRHNATHYKTIVDKNRLRSIDMTLIKTGSYRTRIDKEEGEIVNVGCSKALYSIRSKFGWAMEYIIEGYCCSQCIQTTKPNKYGLQYTGCQCNGI